MIAGAIVCNLIGSVLFFCVLAVRSFRRQMESRGVAPERLRRSHHQELSLRVLMYLFLVVSLALYLASIV